MKIVQTKKETVLIEATYEECSFLLYSSKGTAYKSDIELMCKNETEVKFSHKLNNFSRTNMRETQLLIQNIESALTFLKNKVKDINDSSISK